MKNFCIITNSFKDKELELTNKIKNLIESNNGKCTIITNYDAMVERENLLLKNNLEVNEEIECAIVVGGDGTILQSAKDLYGYDKPIIGINLGHVGFLADIEVEKVSMAIEKLMHDDYGIQERIMISGNVLREDSIVYNDIALNDIVINRFGISRVMSMEVFINDELITTYEGDGLLISTPTGTTGYNLSAGGPIAKPDAKLLVLTPICVHSLYNRSILVSANDKIKVRIAKSRQNQANEAMATFDGRDGFKLITDDVIEITVSDKVTKLVKIENKQFFDLLREKLERKK